MDDLRLKTDKEVEEILSMKIDSLKSEGYDVSFGTIGKRTTYCMIFKGDDEILGYTYVRGDISKIRPCVGRLKSLIQALNRKYLLYESKN